MISLVWTHKHMLNCSPASVQYFHPLNVHKHAYTHMHLLSYKIHPITHSRSRWFKSGCKTPPSVQRLYKRLPLREATGPDERLQSSLSTDTRVCPTVSTLVVPAPSSMFILVVKVVLLVILSFSSGSVRTDTRASPKKRRWGPHREEWLDEL